MTDAKARAALREVHAQKIAGPPPFGGFFLGAMSREEQKAANQGVAPFSFPDGKIA
jgi:hypothetical protein